MRIKICGITRPEDGAAAARSGADAVGFVFWEASPRRVTPAVARAIGKALPSRVARIGVFVDAPVVEVRETVKSARLTAAQLHGEESPGYCDRLGVECYRAFRVARGATARSLASEIARFGARPFLLDTRVEGTPGGTGSPFDWEIAAGIGRIACAGSAPRMILAGGLTPANVAEAIRSLRPFGLLGVDVSSGVESSPGIKDAALMREFVTAVRSAA